MSETQTLYAPEVTNEYGGRRDRRAPDTPEAALRRQYNQYDVAVYRLIKPFYSGDQGGTLNPEGAIISYAGVPNQEMEPMNDLAEKCMEEYLRSLPPVIADVPRLADGRMPELGDIIEAMTKQLRPATPQALPAGATDAKDRVMAALASGQAPDPADLAALAGVSTLKPVAMPHGNADVPAMSGVEIEGQPITRPRGRPPKHPVGLMAPPSSAPIPARIMGSVKMDGPESVMSGPGANLTPGTLISQGA